MAITMQNAKSYKKANNSLTHVQWKTFYMMIHLLTSPNEPHMNFRFQEVTDSVLGYLVLQFIANFRDTRRTKHMITIILFERRVNPRASLLFSI